MPVPLRAPILPVGPRWDGNYQPLFIIAIDRSRTGMGIFVLFRAASSFISYYASSYESNKYKFKKVGNFLLVAPQTPPTPSESVQKSDKGGPLLWDFRTLLNGEGGPPPKVYKSPSTSADEALK